MSRPSWDEYFLRIAEIVAQRATCNRRSVGAILVKDRQILATGYNGAPKALPHCTESGCLREELKVPSGERHELCRGIHAEMNALLQAAIHGISVEKADLYCTNTPCVLCAKMLINVGVTRVVVRDFYPDDLAQKLFKEAGTEIIVLKPEPEDN